MTHALDPSWIIQLGLKMVRSWFAHGSNREILFKILKILEGLARIHYGEVVQLFRLSESDTVKRRH